ncbi:unnamed protein product [Closterium sp. Yama58-4]|nr:unnamed protein product [Closterium sp. Yama58-4]
MGASEAQWGEGAQAVRGTAQSVQGGGEGAGKAPRWLGRHTGAQPVKQDGRAEVHEVRQEDWQEAGEEGREEGWWKPILKYGKKQEVQQQVQEEVEAEEEVPRTMVQAVTCFLRQPGVLLGIAATLSATCLRATHPHWGVQDTAVATAAVCWWLLQEWVLHAKLLHSSFPWWGRSIHAKHHRRPYHHVSVDKPDVVVPVIVGAAIVSRLIFGASTLSLTALMAYYLMAITYEWTHFLVHTHVPMHSWISRSIKNAHISARGCLLLCFLVVAYPFVVRSADVTIRSVTLERDFLGLNALGVEVFMECVNDNVKITLPGVATKGVAVNYTGQEAWQPVMKLNPGECNRCTVYQRKKALFGIPAPTAQWTTCYANFTAVNPNPPSGSKLQAMQPSTGFVTFNSPTELIAVLACPDCNQPSPPEADSSSPPADSSAGSSTSNAADSSSAASSPPASTASGVPSNVTSWMADAPTTEEGNYDVTTYVAIGATLLSVGVVLFVGIIVFYFWRRAKVAQKEADMYRDQAEKSLERGASEGDDLPVSGEARV